MAFVSSRAGSKEGTKEYSVRLKKNDSNERRVAQELVSNGVIQPINGIAFKDILLFGTDNDAEVKAEEAAKLITARVKELKKNPFLTEDHLLVKGARMAKTINLHGVQVIVLQDEEEVSAAKALGLHPYHLVIFKGDNACRERDVTLSRINQLKEKTAPQPH